MSLDFAALGAALLSRAEEFVPQWLPGGRREGHEWLAARTKDGGPGDSLRCNLTTGRWARFSGDAKGGDLTSLYAHIQGVSNLDAARALAPLVNFPLNGAAGPPVPSSIATAPKPTPRRPRPTDAPCQPIPTDDPPGAASAVYRYGEAFVITRHDTPTGKSFSQWTYRNGRWTPRGYPAPRPLFNAAQLAERPDATVLVVEGEKCALIAAAELAAYVAVTWAGGCPAVKQADWTSLRGRNVVIWPDADQPGREAAVRLVSILTPLAASIHVVNTDGQPEGWDIADAVKDLGADNIADWVSRRLVVAGEPAKSVPNTTPNVRPASPPSAHYGSSLANWQAWGMKCNGNNIPHAQESNVVAVLAHHPETRGKIWWDSFRDEVWHSTDGEPRAWDDHDSRQRMYWMQDKLDLGKFTKALVHEGVLIYALMNKRNSVHEMIESEPWDGVHRIDEWLSDHFGCPRDAHHRAAGRNWLISMIARAYHPGCDMHHVLIMEGESSLGKTRGLLALAAPWSHTLTERFGSQAFKEQVQTNWLIELGELTAFANAQHQKTLAEITNNDDRYRSPWDRLASNHLRRCVFAGSTEKHNNYLADTYGIRRFWSVQCTQRVDVDALKSIRQQLFAEALVQYRAGEPYHIMPEQTRDEQLSRVEQDDYAGRVAEYLQGKTEATALEIFEAVFVARNAIGQMIGRSIMEQKDALRIGKCLRQLQWYPTQARRNGVKLNIWQPMTKSTTEQV